MGFGFAGVTDGRLIGCRAQQCQGDAFHLENGSDRWLCADLIARDIGVPDPVGGNGSGLIAYDSDDITVVLMLAKNCGYHGIALSGQASLTQRLNGVIERCTVDTTRRDGIHHDRAEGFPDRSQLGARSFERPSGPVSRASMSPGRAAPRSRTWMARARATSSC